MASSTMEDVAVGNGINYSYVFKFEEEFDHVEVRGKVEEVNGDWLPLKKTSCSMKRISQNAAHSASVQF